MSSRCIDVQHVRIDAEQGYCMPLTSRKDANPQRKALNPQERRNVSQAAGISSYLFQVIFQVNSLRMEANFMLPRSIMLITAG